MKATDLKLGDWVEYFGPVQIAELGMFLWSGWDVDRNFLTNMDYEHIKPIPLTEDVLLGSKFRKYKANWYTNGTINLYYYNLGNYWEVFVPCPSETEDDALAFVSCVKYVHELQHVMWITGVDTNCISDIYYGKE